MTKFDKIIDINSNIDKELSTIESLYNIHKLKLKNLLNDAILENYSHIVKNINSNLEDNFDTISLIANHQIIFYSTFFHNYKTINMSLKDFNNIWKIFMKMVDKESELNTKNELINTINDNKLLKVNFIKTSSRYLLYSVEIQNHIYKDRLFFKSKIYNKNQRIFYENNKDDLWIFNTLSFQKKIKNAYISIAKSTEPTIIHHQIGDKAFANFLLINMFDRIKKKTNGKIKLKILKSPTSKNKAFLISCNTFIPMHFIKHIRNYIYNRTLIEVVFGK